MTSPPATVPNARHARPSMVLLMNRTEPSPIRALTPPGWKLRAVTAAKVGPPFSSRIAIRSVSGTELPPKRPGVTWFGGQAVVNPVWLVLPSSHSECPESGRSSASPPEQPMY